MSSSKTASGSLTELTSKSIAILEDNSDFSDYLCQIIEAEPGLELAFVTNRVTDCLSQLSSFPNLDVLLVDLQLPDGSGLTVIETASKRTALKVLVLSMLGDRNSILKALNLGADGYLLKDAPGDQIVSSIEAALAGGNPVSPDAATHLFGAIRRPAPTSQALQGGPNAPTPREAEIIALLAKGLTYAEVSRVVGLSTHTVGDHVKSIYKKLGANSRGEAVYEARVHGWLSVLD